MVYDDEGTSARAVTVLDAEGGTGATALLQGILATLSEALERLDGRLTSLEGGMASMAAAFEAATADDGPEDDDDAAVREIVGSVAEAVVPQVAALEAGLADVRSTVAEGLFDLASRQSAVVEAVRQESERQRAETAEAVSLLRADTAEALAAGSTSLREVVESQQAALRDGLDAQRAAVEDAFDVQRRWLEDVLAAQGQALEQGVAQALADHRRAVAEDADVQRAVLAEELGRLAAGFRQELERDRAERQADTERLAVLLRGQVAEVSGSAASVAAVLGRLEGRLHELVDGMRALAQQARAARPADLEPDPESELSSL